VKIAVVSDIHGNLPALQAVVEEIDALRPDLVLNLGDTVTGPLWPRETAEFLIGRGWPTISGNHERQSLRATPGDGDDDAFTAAEITPSQRAWLAALPAALTLTEGAVRGFHGIPGDDLRALMETVVPGHGVDGSPGVRAATAAEVRTRLCAIEGELLLCGHTHVPRAIALDGRLVVNPGSVGRPAYDHDQPFVHVVETGSPHARWALAERVGKRWQVEFHAVVYDWAAAARQAEANGRADWADALRSGFVGRFEAEVTGTA
jgi:predicted phosphodiesterase